jgi:hypothetical protein
MRTTLAIDDDVLVAAKAVARQQSRSLGEVISDLARRSLQGSEPRSHRNGIPLLTPKSGATVTPEVIKDLDAGGKPETGSGRAVKKRYSLKELLEGSEAIKRLNVIDPEP